MFVHQNSYQVRLSLVYLGKFTIIHLSTCLFFASHSLSPPFFPLSLLVVTQVRGHIRSRLFSPPASTTVRPLHFYRENAAALSSLVYSRRIMLNHARRSQQTVVSFYLSSLPNNFQISPRRESNSRINIVNN